MTDNTDSTNKYKKHLISSSITALLLSAAFLSACSAPPDDLLSFKPKDKEKRQYQLIQKITFENDNPSWYQNDEKSLTTTLVDIEVKSRRKHYDILMRPTYLSMEMPGLRVSNLSSENESGNEDLREILAAGVSLAIDKNSGRALSFSFNQPIDELGDVTSRQNLNSLSEELSVYLQNPALTYGINLEEGAKLSVPEQGPLPPLNVELVELNDTHVTLRLEANSDDIKLFGYMQVEKDSGWPTQSVMVAYIPVNERGFSGALRLNILQVPIDWSSRQLQAHLASLPGPEYQIDDDFILPELVSRDMHEVLPHDHAIIHSGFYPWELEYPHLFSSLGEHGYVKFNKLMAFDENGNKLDLPLHARPSHVAASQLNDGFLSSNANFWVLGWEHSRKDLEGIARIDATLSWQGSTFKPVSLPFEEGRSEIEYGSAKAVLENIDGVYNLTTYSQRGAYFLPFFEGAKSITLGIAKDSSAPDWLNDAQRLFSLHGRYQSAPQKMLIKPRDDARDLRLMVVKPDTELRAEKPVSFYSITEYLKRKDLPPINSVPLYAPVSLRQDDTRHFQGNTLDVLEPQTFGRPQLYLTLTPEQKAVCKISVEHLQNHSGRTLTMQPYQPDSYGENPNVGQLPALNIFKLMTDDRLTQSFYQHSLDVVLICDGSPRWETVEIDLGDKDWLVSLKNLLGDDWEDNPLANQPMSEFLGLYRFIDKDGNALAISPTVDTMGARFTHEKTLNDFASVDGFLRVAGHISKVKQLQVRGAPIKQRWRHQFPELPGYTGDLYQDVDLGEVRQ